MKSIADIVQPEKEIVVSATFKCEADEGALMKLISWRKGMTFTQIFHRYVNYVKNLHPFSAVVFGEWESLKSMKHPTHIRRS